MDIKELKSSLVWAQCVRPTGSRHICTPPPNTDEDYIVYVKSSSFDALVNRLITLGYKAETNDNYEDVSFYSFRNPENINLIVTEDFDWYNKFVIATAMAKERNLLKKQDRIALFKEVLGETEHA